MSAVRDFLLGPGAGVGSAAPVAAHASLGVLAPAPDLAGVACAAGIALARRSRSPRALVCVSAPGLRPGPPGSRDRLVASLAARDIAASRRGRVVLVALPHDPAEASSLARRATAAAAGIPLVLGTALRSEPLDAHLAERHGLLVAGSGDGPIDALVLASARVLVPHAVALATELTAPARALAIAGLATSRGVQRAVAEALG